MVQGSTINTSDAVLENLLKTAPTDSFIPEEAVESTG